MAYAANMTRRHLGRWGIGIPGGASGWQQFDAGEGVRRLTQNLVAAQESRRARERQAELDRIAEEQRRIENERRAEMQALQQQNIIQQLDERAKEAARREEFFRESPPPAIKKLELTPQEKNATPMGEDEPVQTDILGDADAVASPLTGIKMEMTEPKPPEPRTIKLRSGEEYTVPTRDQQLRAMEAEANIKRGGMRAGTFYPALSMQVPEGVDPNSMLPGSFTAPFTQNVFRASAPQTEKVGDKLFEKIDGQWVEVASAPTSQSAGDTNIKAYMFKEPTTLRGKEYKAGDTVLLSKEEAFSLRDNLASAPTAEMRNTAYQAGAVEPAFDLMEQSLDTLGQTSWSSPLDKMWAQNRFRDQARALAGAILARQAGEGSRLSDEDRRAYSQAATIVNYLIFLPGGIEEARSRLQEARGLINTVQRRRALAGAQGGAFADDERAGPSAEEQLPSPQTEAEYNALPPGTRYIHPDLGVVVKSGK